MGAGEPFDFNSGIKAGPPPIPAEPDKPKSRKPLYVAAGCAALLLLLILCGGALVASFYAGRGKLPAVPVVVNRGGGIAQDGIDRAEVRGWLSHIDADKKGNTVLWLTDEPPSPPRVQPSGAGANVSTGKMFECQFDGPLRGVKNLIIDQRLTIRGENVGTPERPVLAHSEIVSR